MRYVIGFAFWREQILLIFKTKGPEYVVGKYNAIGGKIELGETPKEAMIREFHEETTIRIDKCDLFATMVGNANEGNDYELNCFRIVLPDHLELADVKNPESDGEELRWFEKTFIDEMVPNLSWLLPLSLDFTTPRLHINEL